MYLISRMSTMKTVDTYFKAFLIFRPVLFPVFHLSQGINTPCTSYKELTLIFRIQVNEYFAVKEILPQMNSPGHATLFINGEKTFNSSYLYIPVGQEGKLGSHSYAIVRTQGCVFGLYPPVFNKWYYWIFCPVVLGCCIFFPHHIHMAL